MPKCMDCSAEFGFDQTGEPDEHTCDEMTPEEVAKLFGEKPPKKPKKGKSIEQMTVGEYQAWEYAQDNSNDIYKISARINNAARKAVSGNLTPQGVMVCNTYAATLKVLYDYAEKMRAKKSKEGLLKLIREQEMMPANLIAALGAGVRDK